MQFVRWVMVITIMTLAVTAMSGCGSRDPEQYLQDNYKLINTKTSQFNTGDIAKVYRIPKTPDVAAEEIARTADPDFMSGPSTGRMLLVYPDKLIDITADPEDPATCLAEVASKEFVANNYPRDHFDTGDFLTGYIAAEVIDEIFDVWKYKHKTGSVRKGGTVRGGGPAFGK